MGIKNLNKYLKMNCKESITCINLKELFGKIIVIDISIYLYKYEAEEALIENMYLLLSIFKKYNITPIFIFDGKSPNEKKQIIQQRFNLKIEAETEYNIMKQKLLNVEEYKKEEIIKTMNKLKKKMVFINKDKIDKVKDLIRFYGASYYDAPNEADELCALLVIKKKVWACLSEDMDMFVYGCPRVLRYFSLLNHSVVLYSYKGILQELNIPSSNFKEICILSGTDYNINTNNDFNIYNLFKYFELYKKKNNKLVCFYEWLKEEKMLDLDLELLYKIQNMFDLNGKENLNMYNKIKISNTCIQYNNLQYLLKDNGFIFIE
jgi:flap endonuclease-1